MAAANGHRYTSRNLQIAAVATMTLTVLATWLCYSLVASVAPSGAQPVVWLGALSLASEAAIAIACLHVVAKLKEDQRQDRVRFVGTAIHDVRQPLQAAALFLDNMNHTLAGPQPSKAAQGLDQSIQSVRHILDDLLDLARLDAGAVKIQKQDFNLAGLLHALEAEFAALATARNLRFCFYCPSHDICVHSDPQWVQTLLRKLIINALVKTQNGGVLLGLRQRAGQVLVQVWDTRTGAPPTDGQRSDRGLAIAFQVAQRIQLPLIFESKMERGTVCTLTLARNSAFHLSPQAKVQI